MAPSFVHLHVHTQYSMLDGAIRLKPAKGVAPESRTDLIALLKRFDMDAVALTDHANMFGAVTFYKACKAEGIRPILGCEINVVRETGARGSAADSRPVDHLVMLAASDEGYHNIVRVVSLGQIEPASQVAPSVSFDTVAANAKGVVFLTGCLGGFVPQALLEFGQDAAGRALQKLVDIADPDHVFVELQDHGLPEQAIVNQLLAELAEKMSLPLVATNDVHYPREEDAEAQLLLSCIQSGTGFEEARNTHHGSHEMYLKSSQQMAELFKKWPDAISNTRKIADMCTGWELKLGEPSLPHFPLPEGQDTTTYFIKVAMDGLQERFHEFQVKGKSFDENAYRKRLEHEISVIVQMDFPGYFLIVWDFIRHAKSQGIPVGPGRGSGAGSLVAYAMRITDLDPMPYDLLFERFLNPERVSMPDFDVDFCMDRRDEVIRYVASRYGETSVGQIATFHELKAKSVIKDVARSMGVSPQEAQRLANLIPELGPGKTATVPEAIKMEPKLQAIIDDGGIQAEVLDYAQRLEGLTRHVGMHAAGIVIADGPLWDSVPCFDHDGTLVTQYYMADVEQAGLVKFDFLGLRTLTVIDFAVRLVHKRPNMRDAPQPFDISGIPLDDALTFELLRSGETTGVFQLESSGMQTLFKKLRPDRFEDIIAAVALYRPGPLESGMVDQYVECKHGRQPVQKMHPLIDEVLAPTYGVIVYQEQVMQIAQRLAGYTLGGADLLRRAMGKKKQEEMDRQSAIFLQGAIERGVPAQKAENIFALVAQFAKYGFNRSHSAGYALVTYQSAYLKAHYPAEFLCSLMTADREKTEKVVRMIDEGRAMGVDILPPDINESDMYFKVVYEAPEGDWTPPRASRTQDRYHPKVRFGLGAVRGVGEAALNALFEAREDGPFKDLFDFCARVDARKLNRGVLEALVQCGAFDATLRSSHVTRAQAFAAIDSALERGRAASRDRERGQTSLFGMFDAAAGSTKSSVADYPQTASWDLREVCVREKQALGFYVSAHPLDRYGSDFSRFGMTPIVELSGKEQWGEVSVAGMVESYRVKVFKGNGGKSAFFSLEDKTGSVQVRVSEKHIDSFAEVLQSGDPIIATGKLRFPKDADVAGTGEPVMPMMYLNDAQRLADVIGRDAKSVIMTFGEKDLAPEELRNLGNVLSAHRGTCPVTLSLSLQDGTVVSLRLPKDSAVTPSEGLLSDLERHYGKQIAAFY